MPHTVFSDNAKEFKSKEVTAYLIKMVVERGFTEPKHPNQNVAERRGGTLKGITTHLLLLTGAPLDYWCYAIEYVALIRTVLARKNNKWRTPYELQYGETPDITRFRYIFWQPIWYYHKNASFPNTKMLKGRFIGMATNVCDKFCYLILTIPDNSGEQSQVLARSVVRPRYRAELAPNVFTRAATQELVFYKHDGKTPLDTPSEVDLSTTNNPLQQYLLNAEEVDDTEMEEQDPPLDDSFEDSIVAVLGPTSKKRKNHSSNENDILSEPNILQVTDNMPVTITDTQEAATPLPIAALPTMDLPVVEQVISNKIIGSKPLVYLKMASMSK